MLTKKNYFYYTAMHFLFFLVLAALSLFVLRPLRQTLDERMLSLRDYIITRCEEFFGFEIEYASIGPSLFGFLDIREIRIRENSADPLVSRHPLLSVSRLRVSYSLAAILKGEIPASIRGIYIDKPQISLNAQNMEKYRNIMARLSGGGAAPPGAEKKTGGADKAGDWDALLPQTLLVRIRRGECAIRLEENNISLRGLSFDTRISDGKINLRGKWAAGLSLNYLFSRNFALAMAGSLSGEYDAAGNRGNITLNIPAASGEHFRMRAVNFNILLDQDEVDIKKLPDHNPYEFSLHYGFSSGRVSGEFRADNFSPRNILVLSGPQREYNRYLALTTTGSASFETDGGEGLRYRVDLSGNMGQNFFLGPLDYAIDGGGTEKRVHFDKLFLGFPHGSLDYSGDLEYDVLEPNGTLTVSDFSVSGSGSLNGELAISGSGRRINVSSDNFSAGGVLLSALDVEFTRGEKELAFIASVLRFRNVESWEDIALSKIALSGSLDYQPRELRASLEFDSFSLADILAIARPFGKIPDFPLPVFSAIDDTAITTEVFLTTDFSQISYNVPRLVIAYQGERELVALISLSGTDSRFEISEGNIAWTGGGLNVTGSADFSNRDDISFALRASWREQTYYLEGLVDQTSLNITGSYGFSVFAGKGPFGGYSAYISFDALPVAINGQFARFSAFISMRYNGPGSWYVDLDHFEAADLATPVSSSSALRVSGIIDQGGAQFRDLYFDDGRGELWGEAALSWILSPGTNIPRRYTGSVRMAARDGGEYYDISGEYAEGKIGLTAKGARMQLARVLKNALGAEASGEGRLEWTSPADWSAALTVDALTAQAGESGLILSAKAAITPGTFSVSDLKARYDTLEAEFPSLTIDRLEAAAHTRARVWGTAIGRSMEMELDISAGFTPIDSWLEISRALDSFKGLIRVEYIRVDALENQDPFELTVTRSAAGFSLDGGPRNMIRAALGNDGAFFVNLAYPSPIRGAVTGVLSSKTIDARAPGLYIDMVSLWNIIPSNDIINCTGGFVNASLTIRGPLGDPEFFGFARGSSIRLSVPRYLAAEIGPVPILVTLDGNEMRFGPVNAPCGEGYGEVTGVFRFDRWIPGALDINIRALPGSPIPFSLDILGVLAAGNASGTLGIALEDHTLTVTGDITGDDTEITLDTRQIASASDSSGPEAEDPLSVVTDFTIKTGRKVEFLWPNSNMPILRANAAAGTVIRIESDSESGRFSMNGDVGLKSGEIFYIQRSFYIRNGVLSFNENEIRFDPRITVRAEIRDRTDDGPVTISMIVDNEPLMSFNARFESSPPLSQIDILSLLGQGLSGETPQEDGQAVNMILSSATDVLSQFLGLRRIERTMRDFLGLDMFSFRTQIIPNTYSIVRNSIGGIDAFGNFFDNTTVFAGKYLGPDMFVQGMLTLRYNDLIDPAGGLSEGLYRMNKDAFALGPLLLEPDIGIELHSPLFDIRWNITPMHPENLFISDTSFSLTWRFVF